MKEIFYRENVGMLKHLKRIRLGEDLQMLAIPRYNKKESKSTKKESAYRQVEVNVTEATLKDFAIVVYKGEERVLSDIIYFFKEAKDFPPNIQKIMLAQIHFKAILDTCVMSVPEVERLQSMRLEEDKAKFVKKRKFAKMLFSIFEKDLTICRAVLKDSIVLDHAVIDFEHSVNSTLN
mmetsp:Transcript_15092/g.23335  ORF Transcript_15092/g.23335 Transcript_15092/m.23335 type:complete len:178 (-) Transcript_15092:1378-1911(-)|eukprot:CAMPEP_0170513226 /NCGR_PEP_ID=MMETSP0208-20121228/67285_1 /TAXON_ID=197538 /ORGANISM="Strombidium inclinatum, Strain S3" /LENGTH=177 /DNA_ID=CAMNT_0010796939 /DNA_START=1430 /DNA_END=1963 /DNA_ORIENTATION=-